MGKTPGFSLIVSLLVASMVTLFITAWEWIENPGGIFHGDGGTRWDFVFDTAISWFWPTWLAALGVALVVHGLYRWLRARTGS